ELRELGPHGVVPCRVVAGGPRGQPTLEVACPPARAHQLRARAIALLDLRPQLSRPGAGAAALLEHAVALGLRIRQLGRRLGELLEALPEILPVPGDHLELSVEQRENARVFRPERPLAGGTRALRAELHDLVALLFHFFVLFEQLGALGLGVLPVAYPQRAHLLPGSERVRELLVEPLEFLARRHHRLLRHTPLAVERQRALAACHPLVPARLFPTQRVLRGPPRRVRALGRPAGPAQSLFRGLPRRGERRAVREAGLNAPHLRRHPVADFAYPLLRLAQALVPEHARQKRRPLRLAERRHHGQLLLAREVGVEEIVVGHSQPALEP